MASVEDSIMLLKQAICELADCIGDTKLEPKSFSLLCLEMDIPWEAQSKILALFEEMSQEDYSKWDNKTVLDVFRGKMSKIVPEAALFSDLIVYSFIRVISKYYVETLYPLSCELKEEFTIPADVE